MDLKCYFPDALLARLLQLCNTMLWSDAAQSYHVKLTLTNLFSELLRCVACDSAVSCSRFQKGKKD